MFQNIARLSAGDFLAKALNFLAFVYLARTLGVASFGTLEFASSLLTWVLLAGDGGLELWATREAARTPDIRALAGCVFPLRFLMAALGFALLLVLLPALPDYPALRVLLLLFGLTLFAQAANLKWVFLGQEKMAAVAGGLVFGQVIFAAAIFLVVRDAEAILWVPIVRLASEVVMAAYFGRLFAGAHGGLRLPLSFSGARATLRPALTLGASQAMGLLNYNFDSILLGFLKGATSVGWYNAAYKPVTMALAAPLTYFTGLFPALSRAFAEDKENFSSLVARSFRLCAIVALPLGVGGTLLAEPVIALLFGADYAPAVVPLQILVWSAAFVILRGSYRHALNAAGQQGADLRCALVSAGLNVGLNVLLIPPFDMTGAASATVLADVIWFVMACAYFQNRVQPLDPLPMLAAPLVASATMGLFLFVATPIFWVARAVIGVWLYFGVLLLLGEPEVRAWTRRLAGRARM